MENNSKVASASPAGWIAYSIACWLAAAALCGFVNPDAYLLAGCVALACFVPYLIAAITELKLGNGPGGNTWLYFCAFFALGSALCYLAQYFAAVYGWSLDIRILGFEWIILAIVLILTTPIFLKGSPVALISIIAADVGLLTVALVYWGVPLAQISGWALFAAGLLGWWMGAAGILEPAGYKLPTGKPWFK